MEVAQLLESPLLINAVFLKAVFKCCWEPLVGLHNTQMLQPHYTRLPRRVTCAAVLITSAAISAQELARKRVEMIVSHFLLFLWHPPGLAFFMLLFSLTLLLGARVCVLILKHEM